VARVVKRLAAEQDLDDIAAFLQAASPHTAIRFLEAADRACARLAEMPDLGSAYESPHPALAGLRLWSIRDFKRYVILYRPIPDGIEVVRVVHGARDLESLFGG
jgi:toxin ParE1/3/4